MQRRPRVYTGARGTEGRTATAPVQRKAPTHAVERASLGAGLDAAAEVLLAARARLHELRGALEHPAGAPLLVGWAAAVREEAEAADAAVARLAASSSELRRREESRAEQLVARGSRFPTAAEAELRARLEVQGEHLRGARAKAEELRAETERLRAEASARPEECVEAADRAEAADATGRESLRASLLQLQRRLARAVSTASGGRGEGEAPGSAYLDDLVRSSRRLAARLEGALRAARAAGGDERASEGDARERKAEEARNAARLDAERNARERAEAALAKTAGEHAALTRLAAEWRSRLDRAERAAREAALARDTEAAGRRADSLAAEAERAKAARLLAHAVARAERAERELVERGDLRPRCKEHGVPAQLQESRRPGATLGRRYWVCDAPSPGRCDFFEWAAGTPEPPLPAESPASANKAAEARAAAAVSAAVEAVSGDMEASPLFI